MVENWIELKSGKNILRGTLQHPTNGREKCPILIIFHALMMNSNAYPYPQIAKAILENNIAVLRMDFNGHGDSDGKIEDMTVKNELQDAEEILGYTMQLPFVTDIALLGHSQGGVVAAMLAGMHPKNIKALVLMAAAGIIEDACKEGKIGGTRFNPANVPETVSFYGGRLGREYVRTAQQLQIYETAARYQGAACVIQGTFDEMVPETYARQFHKVLCNSELHMIPFCNHEFYRHGEKALEIAVEFLENHLK